MEMRRTIVAVFAALVLGVVVGRSVPSAAGPQEPSRMAAPVQEGGYLNSYIALLRSDLRTKKTGIVSESLLLTEKESAAFWPVYKRYEGDLSKLYDARLQLIKDYADTYDKMTDAKAKEFGHRAFALEERRVRLRRDYFKHLEKVLPGRTLARFFMLERRIDLLVDLKIASEIPIIE
jgi:hypothetical protein